MGRCVVLCDGTWNERGENQTNIARLGDALDALASQIGVKHYYDEGVGVGDDIDKNQEWLLWTQDKFFGGAFGSGISRNIRDAYSWMVENYDDGDDIYLIGFSRGAYTVRSLAGMISAAGLIERTDLGNRYPTRRDKWRLAGEFDGVCDAYEVYRTRDAAWQSGGIGQRARRNLPIRFVGVFDTVGALGVPIGWIERARNWWWPDESNSFHDTSLSSRVHTARQALAIDERRGPFRPTLWKASEDTCEDVLQVWFAGVHADIGGGYRERGLSDLALAWMIDELAQAGVDLSLYFSGPAQQTVGDPQGTLHNSETWLYKFLHAVPSVDPFVRMIGTGRREGPVPGERVHTSVAQRIRAMKPQYTPRSLVPKGQDEMVLPGVDLFLRRPPRLPAGDIPVRLDNGSEAVVVDMSTGGLGLRLSEPPEIGQTVVLQAEDDALDGFQGVVRWRSAQRCGLQQAA